MKNGAKIFKLNNKPGRSEPHEDHHTRPFEYDDWMRLEDEKYSRLISELDKFKQLTGSGRGLMHDLNIIKASVAAFKNDAQEKKACIIKIDIRDRNGK